MMQYDRKPIAQSGSCVLKYNASHHHILIFLHRLYNRSTADQGTVARFLRGILYFIPIDKNIAFHKLIAKGILVRRERRI